MNARPRLRTVTDVLLSLADSLPRHWNHGNAIHDGPMMSGRLDAWSPQVRAGETPALGNNPRY